MNDNYIEAQEAIEADGRNADRERAYERQEAQDDIQEDTTSMEEKIMALEELNSDYYRDAKIGAI